MTKLLKTATLIPYWLAPQATTHFIRQKSFRADRSHLQGPAREIETRADPSKFSYRDQSIHVYRWEGSGPTVYLAHGWTSRALRFHKLIQRLTHKGYNVIAIDGVGHGRSTGEYSSYPEYTDQTIHFLSQLDSAPDILIGHSMGGSAVARAAYELEFKSKIVMIAPMFSFEREMKKFEDSLPIHPKVYKGIMNQVIKENGRAPNAVSLDSVCSELTNPALFFHDENDKITLPSDTESAHRAWHGSELIKTSGLGHSKLLDDESVLEHILRFID